MTTHHTPNVDKPTKEPVDTAQLLNDFKALVVDAEALIHATADHGGEAVAQIDRKSTRLNSSHLG
jgi:hypothetical protein